MVSKKKSFVDREVEIHATKQSTEVHFVVVVFTIGDAMI
jgi:hypothetical protein